MKMDDLILVAGAGGFIGGHLVAELLRQGYGRIRAVDRKPFAEWFQTFPEVDAQQRDLTEKAACYEMIEGTDHVFNLAADMGGMGFIENNKALCMLSVLINTHLLMASRDAGVSRYFYASSACVYNVDKQRDADVTALREEDAFPALPEVGYGWEKLFSERMCRNFREDFGLLTRVARFHNVYGPHGTWQGGREKAPAAICRKILHAKATGNHEIEIWGDGKQTRSFLYVDECLEGSLRLMRSDWTGPVNIGSEEMVTINQLAGMIMKIAGKKQSIDHINGPLGVRGRNSDNLRIGEKLGWVPSQPPYEGLQKTYPWIEKQVRQTAQERTSTTVALTSVQS